MVSQVQQRLVILDHLENLRLPIHHVLVLEDLLDCDDVACFLFFSLTAKES